MFLGETSAYDDYIRNAAFLWDVPEHWIRAVIETESSWRPNVHNAGDGYGLMQVLLSTARGLGYDGPAEGLFDPRVNIELGTQLLGQLRAAYGDSFERVYSAYNSGRPDLYLTSRQVANNVNRALAAVERYAGEAADTVMEAAGRAYAGATEAVEVAPGMAVVAGLAALLLVSRLKKR